MTSGVAVIRDRFTASWMPACRYRSVGSRQPEYFPMADHWEIAMLPPNQKALPSAVNRFQGGGALYRPTFKSGEISPQYWNPLCK
jgi:hypothetical protein